MLFVLFISFFGLFYTLAMLFANRNAAVALRVAQIRQGRLKDVHGVEGLHLGKRMRRLVVGIGESMVRRMSPKSLEAMAALLTEAGSPMAMRVVDLLGVRILVSLLFAVMGLFLGTLMGHSRGPLFLVIGLLLGWRGPTFWLARVGKERKVRIDRQLPSALDLLTISVEAGLGFDQALGRVAEKFIGPVRDEFQRTLREIQLGATRSEAMHRLGSRAGVDALRMFTSAIIQADKLGSPLARTLRIQSDALRERQRVDAQERALKAPVKMVIPLVLFVFPSVFIVVLGPAMIHVIQLFSKGGLA